MDRALGSYPVVVIDNGSYQCRAGFAGETSPRLICRNHLARLRKERGKIKEVEIQVGNQIENIDAVRFALKSPFDKNVVVQMDVQESILDYVFDSLSIKKDDHVGNSVLMTEAYLNPNYCRNMMTELLFEKYQVPRISYTLASLQSLQYNFPGIKDALVVSLGHRTVEVIPYVNGLADIEKSKRINVGGYDITYFLHKLLQLKYPSHTNTLNIGKIEEIMLSKCLIAENYAEELERWASIDFYNDNVVKIDAPVKQQVAMTPAQIESLKERRREIAKKLTESNSRKREEKLVEDEERLVILSEIKESIQEEEDAAEIHRALDAAGVSSWNELIKQIGALKIRILKTKQRRQSDITTSIDIPVQASSSSKQPKLSPDITEIRERRTEILKSRSVRRHKKSEMNKRKSIAAQERMRILSQLSKYEKDDTFGTHDEDWNVYKSIQKDSGLSDSEDDQGELKELEEVLRNHDPAFASESTGSRKDEHELHIGVERVRAPEILFQPPTIGENQAGLAEVIESVLKRYPEIIQTRLVSNIFVTGGSTCLSGMKRRLNTELMEMRPFESTFTLNVAHDPILDSWKGASAWAAEAQNISDFFFSKAEYDENGPGYFKDNNVSNKFFPFSSVSPLHWLQTSL